MKKFFEKIFVSLFILTVIFGSNVSAQNENLKYHLQFEQKPTTDSVLDNSTNKYNAALKGTAVVRKLGDYGILEIGATAGYLDLGSKVGNVIGSLSDFTIATYLYVDPIATLSTAGNFVWTFSNSQNILTSATGCMFYSAKDSRYAISPTNWSSEHAVNIASPATKGTWQHIVYRQQGTVGTIYINGELKKSGTVNFLPSQLGNTSYNYIGKSSYASDQLLLNSKVADFRIYNAALTLSQIQDIGAIRIELDSLIAVEQVEAFIQQFSLGDLSAVTANIDLQTSVENGIGIAWSTSNPAVISQQGIVSRPAVGSNPVQVVLTATVTKGLVSRTVAFEATVLPYLSDEQSVSLDAQSLTIAGRLNNLRSNLILSLVGNEGCTISWISDQPTILSHSGVIINRPQHGSGNAKVILTATITKGSVSTTREFEVWVAEDEGFVGYLFSYFTGNHITQEQIRFATSADGLAYKAINGGNPVINSADISLTGGVRDPHILRGENGEYLMVVTDMVSANGWSSNRGMVLLRSTDLVNWTSSTVHIPTRFTSFSNVDRVWAPQTIYDPEVGKYMVYFSMRRGSSDYDKIYYSYANSTFTDLETEPVQLFHSPTNTACIDGDIVCHDNQYHMFFKTEGSGNGIKRAVSDKLTGEWQLIDKYLQQTTNAVEGSCVFRLINTDTWILMYDVYANGYYQFTQSEDLDNFSVITNGVSMDFSPRHGTVIPVTQQEMNAINAKWGTTNVKAVRENSFGVYPVPAKDMLTIISKEELKGNLTLAIFDVTGKLIREIPHFNVENHLNVSALPNGIYMLRINSGEQTTQVLRFVVQQ